MITVFRGGCWRVHQSLHDIRLVGHPPAATPTASAGFTASAAFQGREADAEKYRRRFRQLTDGNSLARR
jgi:hypothetical protein